ncbi:MAG: hypothetical protein M3R25_02190 [Bacteroidota bacterium]|nr:hypothetical protein [Bacteroidota bacterium]
MTDIIQWWNTLSSPHQVFWFITIIFSVLFLIQLILLLIGFDSDADLDHPGDGIQIEHEFSALSIRSIIAFFTFFGWTGVLTLNNQISLWMAVILSVAAGSTAMFIVAYLMFKFSQLEQSGTLNLYNALDQTGEVYLSIPGFEKGQGKVHLNVDGRVREIDAITDGDTLKTGSTIKVTGIMDGNVLKVVSMELPEMKKL